MRPPNSGAPTALSRSAACRCHASPAKDAGGRLASSTTRVAASRASTNPHHDHANQAVRRADGWPLLVDREPPVTLHPRHEDGSEWVLLGPLPW